MQVPRSIILEFSWDVVVEGADFAWKPLRYYHGCLDRTHRVAHKEK